MSGTKKIASRGIILNENNEILLVRHFAQGLWTFPGGHIDEGETPKEAIIREIEEELGYTINVLNNGEPISDYEIEYQHRKHGLITKFEYIFLARVHGDTLASHEHEILEKIWMSVDEILALNDNEIYSHLRELIRKKREEISTC